MMNKSINRIHDRISPVWDKVKKHNLLTAVIINAVFLALVLVFCEIKYETSDDYIMAAIMSGAYSGTPNPHMIFINILWGYLLLPFYYLVPQISWYLIAQLALCYCAFTAVTYLMLKRLDTIMGIMLSVLFITFFSDDAYIMVQFTKTAILAVMAGSILFLWALFHDERCRKREIAAGAVLVVAGSLIRYSVIYIAGGFLLLILLVEFVQLFRCGSEGKWRKFVQIAVCGVILIGAVVSAKQIDRYIYNSNPEYKYFREYSSARGGIVDKKDYGYEACEEEYKELGLSENDYVLLRTWNFADPDFYTLELLQKVEKIVNDYQSDMVIDRDYIKYELGKRNYWKYSVLWACAILVLLTIIFNKNYWWASLILSAGAYFYLCYFVATGRIVYRIEYAVFLGLFLAIVYFWTKKNCRFLQNKLELCNVCGILLLVFCVYQMPTYRLNNWAEWINGAEYKTYVEERFYNSWDYDNRRYRGSVYNESAFPNLEKEIGTHQGNFYFLNFSTTVQTLYLAHNPFESGEKAEGINSSFLCGVTVNFPDTLRKLDENDIKNPLKALIEDNVYLVDNLYQDRIYEYLKEHYYPDARRNLYKTADGFQIWKFYKE
ncbi:MULTISPECIES: hypothetical protein [Clostridia]|uniref:hypothetical protein n=1 Tax=Clostridia TaxID=186801 RepID=UPI00067E8888|nr:MULTISPECIES: hypothetical protein [Clostridia]